MPFPLAHPAAVLPFLRKPLVASALVAGAVAPDLLYVGPLYHLATRYIHGSLTLTLTHDLWSAFWLDPLLALLILLGFHLVVKRPLLALAPAALAGRLPAPSAPLRRPSAVEAFWIAVSTVIGALTHVLWDSFTHYDGYFVRRYRDFFTTDITASLDLNRLLGYLSSIGGILAIAAWLYYWWRRTRPRRPEPGRYLSPAARYAVLAAVGVAGVVLAVVQLAGSEDELVGELAIRLALTGLATGVIFALTCYVVAWHLLRLRRSDHPGARAL